MEHPRSIQANARTSKIWAAILQAQVCPVKGPDQLLD